MGKGKVLQDWVGELSWKCQSAILSSLRGPDIAYYPNLKKISRWIRRTTQHNADVSGTYMKDAELPLFKEIKKDLEFCSVHYLSHLLQGLEIIGYNHPDNQVAKTAMGCYTSLVNRLLHLNPETEEQLENRLKDLDR